MPHVMLKRSHQSNFKRCVRDEHGKILRTLEFVPGETVEVSEADLPTIVHDIGKALLPMEWSTDLRKFVQVDISKIDMDQMVADVLANAVEELSSIDPPENTSNDPPPTANDDSSTPEATAEKPVKNGRAAKNAENVSR